MKKADTWMPLYIGDYLADTSRLTTEQHGAYLLILMDYWRNGPPLDDDEELATITKLGLASWRRSAAKIRPFFESIDGRLVQKRAEEERQRAGGVSSKRSESGKAGAAKRWGKQDGEPMASAIANAIANASQNDAPSPSPSPSEKTPIPPSGVERRFDRFWQAYPRKVGKDAAAKAFAKRKPDDDLLEAMLIAIAGQRNSPGWTKDGGQFIPHPSTWLNEGRWQDEATTASVRQNHLDGVLL